MTETINALITLTFIGFCLFVYYLIGSASYNAIKRSRPRRPLTAEEQQSPDPKAVKLLREGRYRNASIESNWRKLRRVGPMASNAEETKPREKW
jgi:hypothetical protein